MVSHALVNLRGVVFFVLLDGEHLRRARLARAFVGCADETGGRGAFDVHPDHGTLDDVEQKIAEMLAESKAKAGSVNEEVKEMGAQSGPSDKVTANQSAQEPSNIAGYSDGVTTVDGDEESNAKNAVKDQAAASGATTKKPNVTTAKATAPEASHLTGVKEDVDALLNGEELSEEFREKATTIFEAAVLSRVATETVKQAQELSKFDYNKFLDAFKVAKK